MPVLRGQELVEYRRNLIKQYGHVLTTIRDKAKNLTTDPDAFIPAYPDEYIKENWVDESTPWSVRNEPLSDSISRFKEEIEYLQKSDPAIRPLVRKLNALPSEQDL